MQRKDAGLTAKQWKTIEALLTCRTQAEAAKKAGINEATIWKYFQNPLFQARYREARKEGLQQGIGRLQQLTRKAIDVLEELLDDNSLPPMVRRSVADTVLTHAFKATEMEALQEIEQRLAELEEKENAS
jgi:AcrR family transcriptional regulator